MTTENDNKERIDRIEHERAWGKEARAFRDQASKLNGALIAHFKEDKESFARIHELLGINGQHFSYFNKNMTEIKKLLEDQNITYESHRKDMITHIERIEPMISSYETDTAFQKTLGIKGKRWGGYIIASAGIIGAWYVIKKFVIDLFFIR